MVVVGGRVGQVVGAQAGRLLLVDQGGGLVLGSWLACRMGKVVGIRVER